MDCRERESRAICGRLGAGDERIYTITITCTNNTDKKSSTQIVTVLVAHDQGK
jgi:hypothetical protein